MKEKLLFVGNFLSRQRGTKGISEKLFVSEIILGRFEIQTASNKLNKVLRLSEMTWKALFFRGILVHIDVFSGSAFFYTRIVARLVSLRGKKILMTLHGGALPEFYERESKRCKVTFRLADKILTPSKYLQNYFENAGFDIHYIPNSIDTNKFAYNREKYKPYSLLWVRAFTEIYNPDVPIRILDHLKNEFPDTELTLVGPDKGNLAEIEILIQELGLHDRIKITGPVPNEELESYYQSHQIYLNTTAFESFGVAVLEAASCGIPVVSNAVGEIPLIWNDNKDILLVNNNDISEYCDHIARLFNNRDLYMKISRAAKENSQSFDSTQIEQEWIKLLTNEVRD